ncbi:MAG: translocation/assembly module TamB domain-containing protein [Verrucomicrobiota bacterium]
MQQTEDSDPEMGAPEKSRKRPAWRKRVFLIFGSVFLLLCALLLIAAGPAFPSVARFALLKGAATQGITGDLKVSGSLFSGFTVSEVNLTSDQPPLHALAIAEVEVDYDLLRLITASKSLDWLNLVRVRDVDANVAVPVSETEKKKTSPGKPLFPPSENFSPVWNLLQSTLEIENLNILIHIEDASYEVTNLSLHHSPEKKGNLSLASLQLPESDPMDGLSTGILLDERNLTFAPFSGNEIEGLQILSLREPEPGLWQVFAELELGEANVIVEASSAGEVLISLPDQQVIDLSTLAKSGETPDLKGNISDLDLRFSGDFANPSTWDLEGKLVGNQLGVADTTLDSLVVLISDNQLNLEALAPGLEITARASAPINQLESTEGFPELPVDLEGRISVPSAEELLSAWRIDVPVTGGIEANLANVQIVGGRSLRSGQIDLRSDTLTWQDHLIPRIDLTARVTESDQLRLDAEIFPDSEEGTFLKGGADFDGEKLEYEGALVGNLLSTGKLGDLLADFGFSATGNLRWHGSGNLSSNEHAGAIEIDLPEVTVQGGRSMTARMAGDYSGEGARINKLHIDSDPFALDGTMSWENNRLSIDSLSAQVSNVPVMQLAVSVPFSPASEVSIIEQPGDVTVNLSFAEFPVEEVLLLFSPETPVAGRLNGEMTSAGTWEALDAAGALTFIPKLKVDRGDPALALDLEASGAAMRPESWNADVKAVLSGLQWDEFQLEDLDLRIQTRKKEGAKWLLSTLEGNQEGASLNANASLDLGGASEFAELKNRPVAFDAAFAVPDLSPLWRQLAPPRWRNFTVAGAISLEIESAQLAEGTFQDGTIRLFTDSLEIEGERIEKIKLDAEVNDPAALQGDLELRLDEISHLKAAGNFHLEEQSYDGTGSLSLNLGSDGVLRRLLGRREIASLLPSSLDLSARASGNMKESTAAGEFRLSGAGLSLAEGAEPIKTFDLDGTFSDVSLDTSLSLTSQPIDLKGRLAWDGNRFEVDSLQATSRGAPVLQAGGSIPFSKETVSAESWFSSEESLSFSITSEPLSLATLVSLVQPTSPLDGVLDLDLNVSGSPARPSVDLDLKVDDITLPVQDNAKAGAIELSLEANEEAASLTGEYRHPEVNPLRISADLPFHPRAWALKERIFQDEKIQLSARMDRSPLSFLSSQVPSIKSIEGFLALNADVTGSFRKPVIAGSGALEVSRMRFHERNAPSLYDVELKTRFDDNRLFLDRFKAIVAGGEVAANGSVAFLPETEPRFDIRIGAREALLFRTPDLSLRTDAALSLTGPWSSATIAGEVGLNNSRFFKNFDLLPSALPMRNTSALPTVERAPRGGGAAYTDLNLGVDVEPFRDWNADVRLFTKTPFQVRSNLVESDLVADLKVSGKLSAPIPRGFIAIDQGDFSLPFSSVDVEIGRIEFDEKTGFNGALNLKAKAKADKYRINVYLYNQILDPQFVLTSVPPLPSEDLLTLLVTGTTRSDLVGGDTGSLAASKAATLLLKNFQKASAKADSEPSLLDALRERTELEIGGVNPETGAETIGGKIRLWKQLFFVGDVDSENDYRALLKYVFRFR